MDMVRGLMGEGGGEGGVVWDAYMKERKVWCERMVGSGIEIGRGKKGRVMMLGGGGLWRWEYGKGWVDMGWLVVKGGWVKGMVREWVMGEIEVGGGVGEWVWVWEKR